MSLKHRFQSRLGLPDGFVLHEEGCWQVNANIPADHGEDGDGQHRVNAQVRVSGLVCHVLHTATRLGGDDGYHGVDRLRDVGAIDFVGWLRNLTELLASSLFILIGVNGGQGLVS